MRTIKLLPGDDNTNGWSALAGPRTSSPGLAGEVRADWVVVGAGFAGLASAHRLGINRPNDKIVLLEAHEVGEGASGRNSGFAIDLPHNVGSSLEELEGSQKFMRLARTAIKHLETQVESHGIACDWRRSGKYHTAVSEKGTREVLEPFATEMETLGESYQWVHKDELSKRLGTPHFNAAVYTPGCILMNPAALTRGLAGALPENVTLYEHSPVTAVNYQNGITLGTPSGQVFAPQMVLAVNGFAPQFGFYQQSLLTMAAHASLTRPLSDEEHNAIGGVEDWGLTPANAFAGITMRYTQDRRILIRQNIHFSPGMRVTEESRLKNRREHQRLFNTRFPALPEVTLEHTWTGFICLANNGSPGFGRVAHTMCTPLFVRTRWGLPRALLAVFLPPTWHAVSTTS